MASARGGKAFLSLYLNHKLTSASKSRLVTSRNRSPKKTDMETLSFGASYRQGLSMWRKLLIQA